MSELLDIQDELDETWHMMEGLLMAIKGMSMKDEATHLEFLCLAVIAKFREAAGAFETYKTQHEPSPAA